jgi:hypothetical protein
MITMLMGLLAIVIAFVAIAFLLKAKQSLFIGSTTGMIVGLMFGVCAVILPGFTHFFGPIEIPDPRIQICGIYTGLSSLYPPILAVVGLIVGACVSGLGKKNS